MAHAPQLRSDGAHGNGSRNRDVTGHRARHVLAFGTFGVITCFVVVYLYYFA